MKSRLNYLVLVLLFAVAVILPARAESYKGTITFHGSKMEYTISNVKMTEKDPPTIYLTGGMSVECEGLVEERSVVKVSVKKLVGRKDYNDVVAYIYVINDDGVKREILKTGEDGTATAEAHVDYNTKKVGISLEYEGRLGRMACKVTCNVVPPGTLKNNKQNTKSNDDSFFYKGTSGLMEYSISGGEKHPLLDHIIRPGNKITLSCSLEKSKEKTKAICILRNNGDVVKKAEGATSASLSYTVPANMKGILMADIGYYVNDKEVINNYRYCSWQVANQSSVIETDPEMSETNLDRSHTFNWDDDVDDRCEHCNGQLSKYYINTFSGKKVGIACNSNKKIRYLNPKYVKSGIMELIHYNNWITVDDDSQVVLDYGDADRVIKTMGATKMLLKKRKDGYDYWEIKEGIIVGKNLKRDRDGAMLLFDMSACVAKPEGTIYVLKDDGKNSRVFLFKGSMEVTNKKDSKKQTLKPGQVVTVYANGKMVVKEFDVAAGAKKYDISLSGNTKKTNEKSGGTNTKKKKTK